MANVPDTRNPSNPQLELGLAKVDIDWLSQSAPRKNLWGSQQPSCRSAAGPTPAGTPWDLSIYTVYGLSYYTYVYTVYVYICIYILMLIYIYVYYTYIYTYTFSDCRHTTLYKYTMFHACMYVTVHDCITLSTYVPLCCLVSLICQLIFT